MQKRGTQISIILLVLLFSLPRLEAQEVLIPIDTTDYLPLPEGLNINLSIAASKGYVFEVHRLIKRGADPDEQDNIGATPLVYAVANGRLNCVLALLSYKVKTDFLTNEGESPLHIASKYGMLEIGEQLIRNGADINIQDYQGCSPLHYSAIYGDIYFTDMLIYYNASLELKSRDGTTPLMAAVWTGDAELSDILLQAGADPEGLDNSSFTPLLIASQNGDTLVTDLLLNSGAGLHSVNQYGYNALDIAIRANQPEMTSYLLKKMALEPSKNKKAVDPFDVARSYGRKEIIDLLNNHGIKKKAGLNFDQVSILSYTKFNGHDIYLGSGVVFSDPYLGIKLSTGIDFKPGYTRVLVEESENSYSQYLDRRYVLFIGSGKDFSLSENYLKGDFNLELNMNIGYMMCSQYAGTYITPDNRFVYMPAILLRWSKKPVNIYLGYEFMNTGLYKAGPGWIKAGASVNIYFNKVRAPLKDIKWY